MRKMFLLFSHTLTDGQRAYAKEHLAVTEFIALPQKLQTLWSDISPDIASLRHTLAPIQEFLEKEARAGDYALIQGDFGAVYITVNFCKSHDITPLYATTKRNVVTEKNTQGGIVKKSIFEFRRFREYE